MSNKIQQSLGREKEGRTVYFVIPLDLFVKHHLLVLSYIRKCFLEYIEIIQMLLHLLCKQTCFLLIRCNTGYFLIFTLAIQVSTFMVNRIAFLTLLACIQYCASGLVGIPKVDEPLFGALDAVFDNVPYVSRVLGPIQGIIGVDKVFDYVIIGGGTAGNTIGA